MNSANESRNSPPPKPRPLPSAGGSGGEYISINDSLPSSSPSGKTVLKVLAFGAGAHRSRRAIRQDNRVLDPSLEPEAAH